jgi:hypothetical protein
MEAKKSLDMPPASWRTRRAGGIIQFKAKGVRTRSSKGVRTRSSKVQGQKMNIPAQKENLRVHLPFLYFCILARLDNSHSVLVRVDL